MYFGSLKALARASFRERRQFLPRLTRKLAKEPRILQVDMLDHVIGGQSFEGRPGYSSFKEAGTIL